MERLKPQAERARRAALVLSAIAVCFAIGFGILLRQFLVVADLDHGLFTLMGALVLLLFALLSRILASICELVWLERTWSNLPEAKRRVGSFEKVDAVLVFGFSFIPVFAWFWKLMLVRGVAAGFEDMRARVPFRAPVPRALGMAAVIIGWVPGLNVYVAPFLWEMFARRLDAICAEIASLQSSPP